MKDELKARILAYNKAKADKEGKLIKIKSAAEAIGKKPTIAQLMAFLKTVLDEIKEL